MGKSHIHTHKSNPYKSTFPSTMSDDRRVRVKKNPTPALKMNIKKVGMIECVYLSE